MPSDKELDIIDELSKVLLDVMLLAKPPQVPARFASVDSFQTLYADLLSLREYLIAASSGDLSRQIELRGYIGGALKTLQANLRHMTWQTKMVASGDFSQRVEFMGEFSQSFNAMVVQLDQTLKDLVKKEMELSTANDALVKEISIRKKTEAAIRESEEALRLLAITDPLTGLYNRRHFNKLTEEEIGRTLRYSKPLSVILFDIDSFKHVNDTFGHTTGDMVLRLVATIIKETIRDIDIPGRFGGEEFIILLPETPATEAVTVAERLRKQIEEAAFAAKNRSVRITASFGATDYLGRTDAKSYEDILTEFFSYADQAMYASKHAGKNRVSVYSLEEKPRETTP